MTGLSHVRREIQWRGMLCALVFLFAWHAKVVVYTGSSSAKAAPVKYSKLWLSGQKIDTLSLQPVSHVPFWVAAFGCLLCLRSTCLHIPLWPPPATDFALHHLPNFFRSPPIRV
jgi:hypothetical protein